MSLLDSAHTNLTSRWSGLLSCFVIGITRVHISPLRSAGIVCYPELGYSRNFPPSFADHLNVSPLLDNRFLKRTDVLYADRATSAWRKNRRNVGRYVLYGPSRGVLSTTSQEFTQLWDSRVNTEAEEATSLEAVTRRQPVNIQHTEKT
jgi:hypothetical protein